MNIDSAFKLYDIRGPYPQVVDERMAFILGKALAIGSHPKKVLIASDTRHSSPILKKFLSDAFISEGVEVCDLAEVPVPQFYFSIAVGDFDLGVMITASHIGGTENGFKPVDADGLPFDEGEILKLKDVMKRLQNENIVQKIPESHRINTTKKYLSALISRLPSPHFKSKIIIDMTKSSVSSIVPGLFRDLGINFQCVKSDHEGNPLVEQNRKDLAKDVQNQKADIGIIWDTDGDRVAFVDRNGDLIPMSFVLGVLAQNALKSGTGKSVAVDVRAGLIVRDLVSKMGGELLIVPAWHQNLQFAMIKDPEIVFAGETTGHFIYRDFFKIDDGILASLKFLQAFEEENFVSEMSSLRHKYFELPEQNFPCTKNKSATVLQKMTEGYRDKNYQISLIDGLTVFGPNWKFNLRESATESLLRLNLETRGAKQAKEIVHNLESLIED